MKKILIIIGKLYVGGAEKVARDIGYYADKSKYDIHYLVFGDEVQAYEQELEDQGCRIIHMNPPRNNHYMYYKELCRLICEEKYDIIHSHTMYSSGWAMYAGYKNGVSIRITHSHTIKGHEKRNLIKNTYESIMRLVINKYSTHCVGCGVSAGYWLFGKKKFDNDGIVIYNGIDLDSYRYNLDNRNCVRDYYNMNNALVIGHVGHFADVKNQKYIVELMPKILEKKKNSVLLLLGDGQTKDNIESLAESLSIKEHVVFTGNIRNVGEYLSAMDVFAFPSKYEGVPLALIEAQANGLPCVISNKIPKDVYLTDLITSLPITEEERDKWVEKIINSKRTDAEKYYNIIDNAGFSDRRMLEKVYSLYDGGIIRNEL